MTLDELLGEYGTKYRIARAFGYTPSALLYWEKKGFIPLQAQAKISLMTNGKFLISKALM